MDGFIFRPLRYKVSHQNPKRDRLNLDFYSNHDYLATFVSLLFNHRDEY